MKLSIIIPAYNEEENIRSYKEELIPIIKKLDYEVLIIDDGSTDNTVEEAFKLKNKRIKIIKHKRNRGLGCAVRTGLAHAKGDLIITLDSDLTFHPRQIPKLLEEYYKTDADCIIGSYLLGKEINVPFFRLILSRTVNSFYNILLGKKIKAISSIFRLYKAEALKELDLKSKGFDINAEILFKLIQKKKKIIEIPATLTTRKLGKSKINIIKEIKNNIIMLAKILLWKMGKKNCF